MKSSSRAARRVLVAAALALASCESPTGSGRRAGPPAHMDLVSGDLQTAVAGHELAQPLVVKVTDASGDPVPGQVVNFHVTAGNGAVFAGAAQTNAGGEARERWTLGTAAGDTQRVEVRAVDSTTGAPLVFAVFRAVATADVPASIAEVGDLHRNGTTGMPVDSLAVRVRDQHGNPVPGTAVVWTVKAGGGTISPATVNTGADGVARAQWTLGTRVDSIQVAEGAAGLTLRTTFTALAAPGVGAAIAKVSGDGQTGAVGVPLAQPLVVRVSTPAGTPIQGALVGWYPASGTVAPAESRTDANGLASTSWTPAANGARSVTAAVLGQGASTTFTANVPDPVQPVLTIDAPGGGMITGPVHLEAHCSACQLINAVIGGVTYQGRQYSAEPNASLDTIAYVAGAAGKSITITFHASRTSGTTVTQTRTVTLSGAVEIFTVPGQVLDLSGNRLLWADAGAGALKVRTYPAGTDQTIASIQRVPFARLTPSGAVYIDQAAGSAAGEYSLFVWSGGAPVNKGRALYGSAQVEGDWVAWSDVAGVVSLLDASTGATTFSVPLPSVFMGAWDVGSNGDLVWASADSVMRRRGGATDVLARGSGAGWTDAGIVSTDGVNVVFSRKNGSAQLNAQMVRSSESLVTLTGPGFVAGSGWAAGVGPGTLIRVTPSGVTQTTPLDGNSIYQNASANAVGPTGAATFDSWFLLPKNLVYKHTLWTAAGELVQLGTSGFERFDGSDLVYVSGGTATRIQSP
jgi:hypothetical protein